MKEELVPQDEENKLKKELGYVESASFSQVTWSRFRKNRVATVGLSIVVFMFLVTFVGPLFAPYPKSDISSIVADSANLVAPNFRHPFGTDIQGYDVFSEIIYGASTAIYVGVASSLLATVMAIIVGGFAGYYGGRVENILMRLTDAFLVIPVLLFLLYLARIANDPKVTWFPIKGVNVIVLILAVFGWAGIARMVRAEFMKLRNMEYVNAAVTLGATPRRIIFRHILPNALPSIIVVTALNISANIIAEASLSFLGFGDPTEVTWGRILQINSTNYTIAWWTALFPGLAIFITALGFNLLGDGLRDALDPRLRGEVKK